MREKLIKYAANCAEKSTKIALKKYLIKIETWPLVINAGVFFKYQPETRRDDQI